MSTTTARVYNFSSGPAVLPVPVLEQIQRDLVTLPGIGMSILEVSHRSKVFEEVIQQAEADIRGLANIPANYKVLFLQGGASLQFSMVPLNLLTAGTTADYIISGIVDGQGGQGSPEGRQCPHRCHHRTRPLHPDSVAERAVAHLRRRLRAPHVEQHD